MRISEVSSAYAGINISKIQQNVARRAHKTFKLGQNTFLRLLDVFFASSDLEPRISILNTSCKLLVIP